MVLALGLAVSVVPWYAIAKAVGCQDMPWALPRAAVACCAIAVACHGYCCGTATKESKSIDRRRACAACWQESKLHSAGSPRPITCRDIYGMCTYGGCESVPENMDPSVAAVQASAGVRRTRLQESSTCNVHPSKYRALLSWTAAAVSHAHRRTPVLLRRLDPYFLPQTHRCHTYRSHSCSNRL